MRFLRMLIGYLLASFGAAMALGMFALSPNSIEGFFDKLPDVVEGAWSVSPYLTGAVALLGAVPAVIAFQYAESNSIRSWVYYELVGATVAIAAYWLAHGTEATPLRGEGNIYSTIAFGVAGAVLGLLYWLFSGRYAGMSSSTAADNRPGSGASKPQSAPSKPPSTNNKRPATA